MLSKIIVVDFEDSFTYNIASVIFESFENVEVISHKNFFKSVLPQILMNPDHEGVKRWGIVLGPGPGHPEAYREYFSLLEKLLMNPRIYVMGICLGHQILALLKGYEIKEALTKLHGHTEEISYQEKTYLVQRYNSLAVYQNSKEINIREGERFSSFQFHPESVGTEKPMVFFKSILDFVSQT